MGDPKLLEKFREVCEAYDVEYAFEGIVEGYIIEFYRIMAVHTEEGTRLVNFSTEKRISLDVGDRVIVIGISSKWHETKSVLPIVLFNPKERSVLIFRKIQPENVGKSNLSRFQNAALALSIAMFVSTAILWQYNEFFFYGMFVLGCLLFTEFCLLESSKYLKLPRLFHCDEQTWHLLTEEIETRFVIKLAV